jgi:hypothetical protein
MSLSPRDPSLTPRTLSEPTPSSPHTPPQLHLYAFKASSLSQGHISIPTVPPLSSWAQLTVSVPMGLPVSPKPHLCTPQAHFCALFLSYAGPTLGHPTCTPDTHTHMRTQFHPFRPHTPALEASGGPRGNPLPSAQAHTHTHTHTQFLHILVVRAESTELSPPPALWKGGWTDTKTHRDRQTNGGGRNRPR